MKIKNDHLYRQMGIVYFDNKKFMMFRDAHSKLAFLEMDVNNKLHYPELRDVLALANIMAAKPKGLQAMIFDNKNKKIKKFHFIPKVKIAGVITLLTASMLVGCGTKTHTSSASTTPQPGSMAYGYQMAQQGNQIDYSFDENVDLKLNEDGTLSVEEDNTNDYSPEDSYNWGMTEDEIADKYLQMLSPSDDEYDFRYANDNVESEVLGYIYARDSKGYERIFHESKPTLETLYNTIDGNAKLSADHKQFLKDYCKEWLSHYPESDLSVFNYNLRTLEIQELSAQEIQMKTMSTGTVACYLNQENIICLNKDANYKDKTSNDYVVFMHEITHATRTLKNKDVYGKDISIRFYEDLSMGLYEDEALDTYFCYEIQGLDHRSVYYTYQSSIFRQFMPYLDYNGSDYMNHSVNYFIEKLQEYFDKVGIETPAYHFINLLDSQAKLHYDSLASPDYTNFSELYDVLCQLYIINHISSDMSYEQTEAEFEKFYEDMTYNFENLENPYPEITRDSYKVHWDQRISELGIENAKTR